MNNNGENLMIGEIPINTKYYKNDEFMQRGDWKDRMLAFVKKHSSYEEALSSISEWAFIYHLSPLRRNLLSFYNFTNISKVLEVGAGCGALTGLLAEKCSHVTCNDLSLRRSIINAQRHCKVENIDIIVGDVMEIEFAEKFDLIVAIGVFEYVAVSNPEAFLKKILSMLNKGGKLLLAIENKFGLQYWAGYPEDHTNRLYDSIEGYSSKEKALTFSRNQLESMVLNAGFNQVYFFYPVPDYKFPKHIFSDKNLPSENELNYFKNYRQRSMVSFNEEKVLIEIIKDEAFPFFANSFLVEAR